MAGSVRVIDMSFLSLLKVFLFGWLAWVAVNLILTAVLFAWFQVTQKPLFGYSPVFQIVAIARAVPFMIVSSLVAAASLTVTSTLVKKIGS